MASQLKFAILFQAIDQMTGTLNRISGTFNKVGDQARAVGDRMVEWGEKIGITTAILSEGASKLHEWSDAMIEPAMAMERSMATMTAMTGLGGKALDEVREHAIAFSSAHAGVTAEQWADSFTRLRDVFQDTHMAMAAADAGTMLSRFGVGANDVVKLFGVAAANLGTSAPMVADQLVAISKAYGINAGEDISRLAMAYGRLGGLAKNTGTSSAELMSLLGEADKAFGGGRGMGTVTSIINELVSSGKSGVNWSHGLVTGFEVLKSSLAGESGVQQIAKLKSLGISGEEAPQFLTMLNNLPEIAAMTTVALHAAGENQKTFGKATANASDQTQLLHQNIGNLYDAITAPALPTFNRWLGDLIGLTKGATSAMDHHSTAARYFAIAVTGAGSAGYYGMTTLSALGTASFFAGEGFKKLGGAWNAVSGEGIATRIRTFGGAIARIGQVTKITAAATKLWAAAQWLWDAAMGVGLLPLLAIVAGAALLGVAAYEIYEHWGAVAGFLERMWASVKRVFTEMWGWMRTAGVTLMKSLGDGILAGIEWPLHAASALAHKIGGYFIGHSPPPYGPLRELGRMPIPQMIADTMRPAPIIAAANRVARSAMVAAPAIAIGAAIPAFASVSAYGRRGADSIVINAPLTINMPAGAATGDRADLEHIVVTAFRRHKRELLRAVEDAQAGQDRRKF